MLDTFWENRTVPVDGVRKMVRRTYEEAQERGILRVVDPQRMSRHDANDDSTAVIPHYVFRRFHRNNVRAIGLEPDRYGVATKHHDYVRRFAAPPSFEQQHTVQPRRSRIRTTAAAHIAASSN